MNCGVTYTITLNKTYLMDREYTEAQEGTVLVLLALHEGSYRHRYGQEPDQGNELLDQLRMNHPLKVDRSDNCKQSHYTQTWQWKYISWGGGLKIKDYV